MSVAAFPRPAPMPASSSNHSSSGRVAIPRVMAARPAAMAPRPANMAPRPSSGNIATRPSQAQSQQPLQARSAAPTPPSNPRRQSNTSVASSSTASMAPPAPSPSASLVGAGGSKDTSSSSGKVFAKPSKEWVLPERAKPGRKVSVEEPDNKRQSQNRLSQRAHRARRTDYITTLEERLRQYEADEIHSNVRLQEVARALKADNERLKTEVAGLRDQVTDLSTQQQSWETERQGLESLIASLTNEVDAVNRVGGSISLAISTSSRATARSRRSTKSDSRSPVESSLPTLVPDTAAQRETLDCPICPNPDPDCPCQQKSTQAPITMPRPTGSLAALTLAVKAMAEIEPVPTPGGSSSCGLCLSTDECLCRVVEEQDVKPTVFPTPSPELMDDDGDGCGLCTSASFCACKAAQNTFSQYDSPPVVARSKLPTPPNTFYPSPPSTVVAAVPLRLRRPTGQRTSAAPLWRLEPVAEGVAGPTASFTATREDAVCSGDPSNCAACKDDRFGQEFCSNIFERVEEASPAPAKTCNTCPPGSCMSINSLVSPPGSHYSPPHHLASAPDSSEMDANADTMTCDQAWKTLKAHPNSRFASLSLLADVVSGRTRSTGPVIDSTTPGSASSPASPAVAALSTEHTVPASRAVESTIAPVSRKRNLAVETSAVRNALRLLDSTPTPAPSPGPVDDRARDEKRRRIGV